jgi:hypothetical protein
VTRSESQAIVKKDLSDVVAGLLVAAGTSLLVRLLSKRGRVVRLLAVSVIATGTTYVRHQFAARRKTTTYSLTRDVDRSPIARDDSV